MACCEHKCGKCDWSDMSNDLIVVCPMCGSSDITTWYDEADAHVNEPLSPPDEDSL